MRIEVAYDTRYKNAKEKLLEIEDGAKYLDMPVEMLQMKRCDME